MEEETKDEGKETDEEVAEKVALAEPFEDVRELYWGFRGFKGDFK